MFLNQASSSEDEIHIIDFQVNTLGLSQEIQVQNNQPPLLLQQNNNYIKQLGNNNAKYDEPELNIDQLVNDEAIPESQIIPIDFEVLQFNSMGSIELPDKPQQYQDEYSITRKPIEVVEFNTEQRQVSISELIPVAPQSPYGPIINNLQLPVYLKQFLISPFEYDGMFQCIIVRDKSGINRLYPKFTLYDFNTNQYLMTAQRTSVRNSNKYTISESTELKSNEQLLTLGKVERSKSNSTQYCLYDNGVKVPTVFNKVRKQLGAVFYDSSVKGPKKPRNKTVMIRGDDDLNIATFVNRLPQLKQQSNWEYIYTLNFFGRVRVPSVKNFQLVKQGNPIDQIFLQFGKYAENQYTLDFRSPMSPLIAFQIAITSFDYKNK